MIGGTGFIGREIVDNLDPDSYRVLILFRKDRVKEKTIIQKIHPHAEMIVGKLGDIEFIESVIVNNKVDIIVHLASNLVPISTSEEFEFEHESIISPTFKIIEMIARLGLKLIYFSSGGNLYKQTKEKVNESSSTTINSFYGKSKLMLEEKIISESFQNKLLNYLIIRPSNVYGRLGSIDSKQGFIENSVVNALEKKPIKVWGDGLQTRDYIHISDLVRVFTLVGLKSDTQGIINIASGNSINLKEILEIITQIIGREPEIIFDNTIDPGPNIVNFDIGKLKTLIDFNPITIEAGIKDLVEQMHQLSHE